MQLSLGWVTGPSNSNGRGPPSCSGGCFWFGVSAPFQLVCTKTGSLARTGGNQPQNHRGRCSAAQGTRLGPGSSGVTGSWHGQGRSGAYVWSCIGPLGLPLAPLLCLLCQNEEVGTRLAAWLRGPVCHSEHAFATPDRTCLVVSTPYTHPRVSLGSNVGRNRLQSRPSLSLATTGLCYGHSG